MYQHDKKKTYIICLLIMILVGILAFLTFQFNQNKRNFISYGWNEEEKVNEPNLLEGMTAVMFESDSWYNYQAGQNEWANVKTEDGSLWVWIPRYAYKITTSEDGTNTIDVMFLKDTTNLNEDGISVEKLGYRVHPAFQNGEKTAYRNGEWSKEITGIWVSKFEAGKREQQEEISYPIFQGGRYSYNMIQVDTMYELSISMTDHGNPYGFDSKTTDSHMMKNSEWGAVAYLSFSKYGTNGSNLAINNVCITENEEEIGGVTGYGSLSEVINDVAKEDLEILDVSTNPTLGNAHAWDTEIGQLASTTANLYGVYDMRGGMEEYVAGVFEHMKSEYGVIFKENKSSPYITTFDTDSKDIYGDATYETSTDHFGYASWFGQTSLYIDFNGPIFMRGGNYSTGRFSGLFYYNGHTGHEGLTDGFRVVIIPK